ncbi:MAG: alpha/beta hydrolase family protein [Acidimicrobiales bacterium]
MRSTLLVILVALLVVACGTSDSDIAPEAAAEAPAATATPADDAEAGAESEATAETTEPTATPEPTAEPEPLELIGDGPYGVGSATVTIDADTDRPLTLQLWFPVEAGLDAESTRYTFITGDSFLSARAVDAGADQIAGDGPFPLVVYSHGSGGLRYIHSDYTETLASHGHVVVAPDHTGNTAVEQFLGTEDDTGLIAATRPADVIAVIDAMTDPADPEAGAFAAAVDAEHIAVTGHSFGGFTTYAVVSGYETPAGAIAADERVDAIIPLAPAVGGREGPALLTDDQLAAVGVPALVIVGTDDKTTPVEPNVERAWELTASDPHYRLELVAAEHQSFTDVCDYQAAAEAGQELSAPVLAVIENFAVAGCAEGDMPIDRVQELTNTFALRFLASVFDDEPMIDPAATADLTDVVYAVK